MSCCHWRPSSTGYNSTRRILDHAALPLPLAPLANSLFLFLDCSLSSFAIIVFLDSDARGALALPLQVLARRAHRREGGTKEEVLSPRLLHSLRSFRFSEQLFEAEVYRDELLKMQDEDPSLIRLLLDAWVDEGKAFIHGSSEICICLNLIQNIPSEVIYLLR